MHSIIKVTKKNAAVNIMLTGIRLIYIRNIATK